MGLLFGTRKYLGLTPDPLFPFTIQSLMPRRCKELSAGIMLLSEGLLADQPEVLQTVQDIHRSDAKDWFRANPVAYHGSFLNGYNPGKLLRMDNADVDEIYADIGDLEYRKFSIRENTKQYANLAGSN